MEEKHDVAHHFLFGPGVLDALAPLAADSVDFLQAFRLVLDDVEDLLPEFLHEFRGVDRADPLDHAASEILLDPFQRGGGLGLERVRLELDSVIAVTLPGALCGHPFARCHRRK